MGAYTKPVWLEDFPSGGSTVIRDIAGKAICIVPHDRPPFETAGNIALISLAPELFRSVCELVAVMRASDVEKVSCGVTCDSDDWDAALDEAQDLLDLLTEDGVTLDDADETDDGVVVIPLPMMQPPAVVAVFKAADGDIGFIVHADDEKKTFVGQYGIARPLFAWARSALQGDGPLCGVLRDNRRIVGEIFFYPGRILKVMIGEQTQSVELAQEDIDDIVSLFGEH